MGKGRKPGSIGLCILLVALAIQGVTPDIDDLPSPRLLQVIDPVDGRTISRATDDFPCDCILLHPEAEPPSPGGAASRGDDQDQTPDEPGVSAEPAGYRLLRYRTGHPHKLHRVKAGRAGLPPRPGFRRLTYLSGTIGNGNRLIYRLCRLTC